MNVVADKLISSEAKLLEKGVSRAGNNEHRLSNLDGIRGIAIALVLICHSADLRWSNGLTQTFFFKAYWHIAQSLWVGVDVFFVLSGFLITSILIRTRAAKNYYTGFYGRRVIRIMPMFVIVLSLVGFFLFWNGQCKVWQFLILLFSLGNWLTIYEWEISPLVHFWTLAVEEQFYLVWPVVAKTFTQAKLVRLCIGLFISATLLRIVLALSGTNIWIIYKITPARWDGLALGAYLACLPACPHMERWFLKNIRKIITVSAICLALVIIYNGFGLFLFSKMSLALGLPFVDLLALGLVFTALQVKGGLFFSILNSYPLQWLGRYSYSIYLIHYPFYLIANWLIGDGKMIFMNLFISVGVYVVTPLLLARLAWILVEQPFMNFRYKFKPLYDNDSISN
jgi:peptidoglycan/LPS O-acetylase OafA/YrhL